MIHDSVQTVAESIALEFRLGALDADGEAPYLYAAERVLDGEEQPKTLNRAFWFGVTVGCAVTAGYFYHQQLERGE